MKTGAASTTAIGWITSIVPTPVPTPRPLRNPAKTDQIAPATAAAPHRTSTSGSPPVTQRANRTGNAPLARSPATTTAAHRGPSARRALVPPVRPEPIVRGSAPPALTRDQHTDRDRPGDVGDEHQDRGPSDERGVHRFAPARSGHPPVGSRWPESSIGSGSCRGSAGGQHGPRLRDSRHRAYHRPR